MSKLRVFSVYDCKVEAYMQPFMLMSRGQAIRSFTEEVANPKSLLCRHPGDFTLFEIGEFDECTGELTCHEAKVNLGTALEYKNVCVPPGGVQVDIESVPGVGIGRRAFDEAKASLEDGLKK